MSIQGLTRQLSRFGRDEAGTISVLAVGGLVLLLIIGGIAIDGSNVFRHRALMQLTADIAAHAGLIRLTKGDSPEGAIEQTLASIEANMPYADYGRLIDRREVDVQVLHYDPDSNSLSSADFGLHPPQCRGDRLQRSGAVANRLPSLVLGAIGLGSWDLDATSVAALVPVQRCSNAAGLYAEKEIHLSAGSTIGDGLCVHSQITVTAAPSVRFSEESNLSMPDLASCDIDCQTAAEEARRVEMNIMMPETRYHVMTLAEGFASPRVSLPQEAAFFAGKALPEDLSALDEVGVPTDSLRLGSVVSLGSRAFNQMRAYPGGIVYRVTCSETARGLGNAANWPAESSIILKGKIEEGEAPPPLSPTPRIAPTEDDGSDTSEGGLTPEDVAELIPPDEGDFVEDNSRLYLNDLVLVTNCAIRTEERVSLQGSLLILVGSSPETLLDVAPDTWMADPDLTCRPDQQTTLMTTGSLRLSGSLAQSNLAVVAGGDLMIDSGSQGNGSLHVGASFHAGGQLVLDGPHDFIGCDQPNSNILPPLQTLSHVMPPLKDILPQIDRHQPVETEMPGEKVKPLPRPAGETEEDLLVLSEDQNGA